MVGDDRAAGDRAGEQGSQAGLTRAERRRPHADGVAGRRKEQVPRTLTEAKRGRFLDALATTCCVTTAAEAAGVCLNSFYALRRRDAGFREEWQGALEAGYDAVEGRLLGYVLSEGADVPAEAAVEAGVEAAAGMAGKRMARGGFATRFRHGVGEIAEGVPTWVHVAIALLNRHRASVDGTRQPMRSRRGTPEEANAMLRKRLDQLARSIKAPQ